MSDRNVVREDLKADAERYERKAAGYGEDLGEPYRRAAEALREILDAGGDA